MFLLIFKLLVYFCKYKENFYILLYESHLINDIVITLISHANYSFLFIKKTEGLIVLSPWWFLVKGLVLQFIIIHWKYL